MKKIILAGFILTANFMFGQNIQDSLLLKITSEPSIQNYENSITIAEEYIEKENFTSSLLFIKKALEISEKLEDKYKEAHVYEMLGDLYLNVVDYEKAINYYFQAKTYFEENDLVEENAKLSVKIASINMRIGNIEDAILQLSENLNAFKVNKNLKEIEEIYYLLGIAYGSIDKIDSSLLYFNKSLKIVLNQIPLNNLRLAGLYNNIGALYSKLGNDTLSLENYHKAFKEFEAINNTQGKGVTYGNIAYLYQKRDDFENSKKYYDSTLFNLDENNKDDMFYLESIFQNISNLYEKNEDINKAFFFYQKYVNINDSLSSIDTYNKVVELKNQFELHKKDRELVSLEIENENKKQQQYLLILIILLLLILVTMIYFTMKTSVAKMKIEQLMLTKEKGRLEKEIKYKNKEIEDFAFRIIEKNKFLEELNANIKNIKVNEENSKSIKELTSNIRNNLYINKDRRDFEEKLEDIHKSFMNRLDDKIPNLSKSEKRLCCLLIMDLSSKDMSTILNISLQGVKTARHRLRKKLNLSSDEDLAYFLTNL